MIRTLWMLLGYNLYDTKRFFSLQFAAALERRGIQVKFIDLLHCNSVEKLSNLFERERPDLCCSFDSSKVVLASSFWEHHQIPFWRIYTGSAIDFKKKGHQRYFLYSLCDHFEVEFLRERGFDNVIFFGHGVDKDIVPLPEQEKTIDVVYLGTSYDPETLRKKWESYPENIVEVLKRTIELYLSDHCTPVWKVLDEVLRERKLDLEENRHREVSVDALNDARGWDRIRLIRAIEEAPISVYGGTLLLHQKKVKGWAHFLADKPNVSLHPAVRFDEAIEVMKKAKICLNSMPFFKNGTHERLFLGAACGCLVINTDTLWTREHFVDGQDLILYRPNHWEEVNEKVNYYLAQEEERLAIAERGRKKVMQNHTWDHRVDEVLQILPSALEKITKRVED